MRIRVKCWPPDNNVHRLEVDRGATIADLGALVRQAVPALADEAPLRLSLNKKVGGGSW
jgi:hypothetical protein